MLEEVTRRYKVVHGVLAWCYSVFQGGYWFKKVLHRVIWSCTVLEGVTRCCTALDCISTCYRVLRGVTQGGGGRGSSRVFQGATRCYGVLQRVTGC